MSQGKDQKGASRPQKKKKAPPYTGKALIAYRTYLVLTIIAAVIVVVFIVWNLFSAAPNVPGEHSGRPGSTRPPVVTTMVDPNTGEEIEVEIPGLPADRKEEFYTFLLVGKSQETGGGLTDTMMLAAYDVPNQALSVMSLPRDTWVRYNGRTVLINSVYNAAGGDKDGKGIEGLKSVVKDLTGIYPDFYGILQWEAVGELVDAIGGVDFEVPFDMYYNDLSQHFKIDLKKGYQTLNGEQAMGLIRWRHNSDNSGHISSSYGYAEGDIGRIKTQQSFLKAVIKKCLRPEVLLGNLAGYLDVFQRNVVTDLSVGNISYFVKSAVGGLDMDNVSFVILPNRDAGDGAHLLPNGNQIVAAVNGGFNPYEEDIRVGELRLAAESPLAKASDEPEESEGPEESGEPEESETPEPDESQEPDDDIVLPPGVTRPPATPRPSESRRPAESGKPSESEEPTESGRPSDSPKPSESEEPTESDKPSDSPRPAESEPPVESAPPAEPTPAPSTPTPDDDEPLLPPGV